MHPGNLSHLCLVWILAVVVAGCGRADAPSSDVSDGVAAGQPVDLAAAGSITGSVRLDGTAPANEPIKMNAGPVCVRETSGLQHQETFVARPGGALANVFVYVKDGLGKIIPTSQSLTRKADSR